MRERRRGLRPLAEPDTAQHHDHSGDLKQAQILAEQRPAEHDGDDYRGADAD